MFRVCLPRLRALNPSRARLASTTPTPSALPAAPQYLKVTRRFHRMLESKRPLQLSDGPLVWIDCEMTGLDHRRDKIIEIAVIITNGNLEPVDEGIRYAIRTDKESLDKMDQWCIKTHGESGLTAECLASPHTLAEVEQTVLQYVRRWIPHQRMGVLAGSSVHVDRQFLCEQMPALIRHLHYRIVDCSTVKELAYRWYPNKLPERIYTSNHRALDDIKGSIAELAWHRKLIFKSPESV